MLVFVNYVHFSKKIQKFCFYFLSEIFEKFDNNISITRQQTSKWQTHLTYGIAGFQYSARYST